MAIDWQVVALIGVPAVGALTLALNWQKLRPEKAQISTEAAENSILVMKSVQDALDNERLRLAAELKAERDAHATTRLILIELQERERDVREREKELNDLIGTLTRLRDKYDT